MCNYKRVVAPELIGSDAKRCFTLQTSQTGCPFLTAKVAVSIHLPDTSATANAPMHSSTSNIHIQGCGYPAPLLHNVQVIKASTGGNLQSGKRHASNTCTANTQTCCRLSNAACAVCPSSFSLHPNSFHQQHWQHSVLLLLEPQKTTRLLTLGAARAQHHITTTGLLCNHCAFVLFADSARNVIKLKVTPPKFYVTCTAHYKLMDLCPCSITEQKHHSSQMAKSYQHTLTTS